MPVRTFHSEPDGHLAGPASGITMQCVQRRW
jgi:hypothetical protein